MADDQLLIYHRIEAAVDHLGVVECLTVYSPDHGRPSTPVYIAIDNVVC